MMVTTSRNATRPRLNCEQLESRENPAGNVSVFISGAQLIVAGDAFDNAVSTQQDQFGNVVIIGVNGTTVNGQSAIFLGPFIPFDAIFDGGAGNDQIDVAGLFVSRQLTVSGGSGNDLVQLRGVNSNFITVATHDGNDTLIGTNVVARTGMQIDGGTGFDIGLLRNISAGSFFFHSNFEQFV
jgi:hypothetical protein